MINLVPQIERPVMTFTVEETLIHVKERIEMNPAQFALDIEDFAKMLWDNGHKVSAMKFLRIFFPIGLREVKEHCEAMFGPA